MHSAATAGVAAEPYTSLWHHKLFNIDRLTPRTEQSGQLSHVLFILGALLYDSQSAGPRFSEPQAAVCQTELKTVEA